MSEWQLSSITPRGPVEPGNEAGAGPGCWRLTGVYGNRQCPDLARHLHCRNCPVHAKAGLEVLNHPLPAGYVQHWTEHYAKECSFRQFAPSSAVPFRLGSEWLALPTECFQEITERRPIHSIPHSAPIVLGLANIRGELLICISLGHLLGLAHVPPRNLLRGGYQRLLVLYWMDRRFGFPVDEVHGPHRFHAEDVKPLPLALAKADATYAESILSWQERTLVLLDPDLLCSAMNRNLS